MQLSVIRLLLSAVLATTLTSCGSGPAFPFDDSLNATTIFIGDSITQFWPMPDHNGGISGQITAQMLDRFSTDVVGHGFKRVVILGGSNDVANKLNLSAVRQNIDAMATIAESAGLEVVLCKIPPRVDLNQQMMSVNQEIAALAQSRGFLLVDYFTPMYGHPEFFKDSVHPNAAGYAVMETALSRVVIK